MMDTAGMGEKHGQAYLEGRISVPAQRTIIRSTRQRVAAALIMAGLAMSLYPNMPWCSLTLIGLFLHGDLRNRLSPLLAHFHPALLLLGLSLLPGTFSGSESFTGLKATIDVLRGFAAGLALWVVISDRSTALWLARVLIITLLSVVMLHLPAAEGLLRTEAIRSLEITVFGHPARLSAMTVLMLLVIRSIHLNHSHLISRYMAILTITSGLLVLGWSSSRGPILMLLLSFPVSLLMLRSQTPTLVIGILVTLALTPITLTAIGHVIERGTSDSGRLDLWSYTISLWQTSPWVGLGNNMFKTFPNTHLQGAQLFMPHNIYLEQLFSSGLAGCTLLVVGLVLLLWQTRQNRSIYSAESLSGLLFFLLLGLIDTKLMSSLGGMELAVGIVLLYMGQHRINDYAHAAQKTV